MTFTIKQNSLVKEGKHYDIIDGQQRTTLLRMLIRYVVATYGEELPSPPKMCIIDNESFNEYEKFQSNNFSFDGLSYEEVQDIQLGDKYKQAERYQLLWDTIKKSGIHPAQELTVRFQALFQFFLRHNGIHHFCPFSVFHIYLMPLRAGCLHHQKRSGNI